MAVKLIAHTLIEKDGQYLLIKRSKIKRGLPNVYPYYWDIPGGSVEEKEAGTKVLASQLSLDCRARRSA